MLHGARILIATKHKKEEVIEPALVEHLGADCFVPSDFDTDQYGTFDGEVLRVDTPYETAIKKAREAGKQYGHRYVIASEGSFGPHPVLGLIPGDVEHLIFYDLQLDKAICEVEISAATNFSHFDIKPGDIFDEFLDRIKFGTHAINIRMLDSNRILAKGLNNYIDLCKMLEKGFFESQIIRLETDMRAMNNPTRMEVIRSVAERLAKRLAKLCPSCASYGFGEVKLTGVLPCSVCDGETTLHQHRQITCIFCNYSMLELREDRLIKADQQYCLACNP